MEMEYLDNSVNVFYYVQFLLSCHGPRLIHEVFTTDDNNNDNKNKNILIF